MNPRNPTYNQEERDINRMLDNAANDTQNTIEGAKDEAKDVVGNVRAKAEELVGDAKDKASEVSGQASEKVDAAMTNAGQQINRLAQTVREKAPVEGRVGEIADSAADALEKGGRYLQEADVQAVRGDLENMIRQHPVESLLVGVGVGFLLARSFRR